MNLIKTINAFYKGVLCRYLICHYFNKQCNKLQVHSSNYLSDLLISTSCKFSDVGMK